MSAKLLENTEMAKVNLFLNPQKHVGSSCGQLKLAQANVKVDHNGTAKQLNLHFLKEMPALARAT